MTSRPVRGFRELLGEQKWAGLLDHGVERTYPPRSTLMRQGEPGTWLLAVVSGRVKVYGTEPDGGRLLIALRAAGDLIGEIAARTANPRTATVEAIDRCTARLLSAEQFTVFLDRHDGQRALGDYVISKLSQTVPYEMELVHFSAERKIARLLLEVLALADDAAVDPARIPFSQQELADALGMVRSTVAQYLQRFKDSGALAPGPRLTVADPGLLRAFAGV
ncbi:Crp/Fnr family transcriptional regulator [Actinokineospora inagensis]|uniref:Crp/Fnr family transcriptional regulator n=1 Tax=Actinokineospora inagensis TaxID=103730 RepID=UPI000A006E2C|nr:Crp/Fnr family transcriptional regulator [Actinokineospora inagensis]